MGFTSHPDRPPKPPSRLRLLLVIMLAYGCVKVFGHAHVHLFHLPHPSPAPPPPIIAAGAADDPSPFYFGGRRITGNGTDIDLGDRRTHLPGALISRFFPAELILPSCLTEPPPLPALAPPQQPGPVHDDWPGFYGAPWVARVDGNLIVLLNVVALRDAGLPLPAPQFQIYPHYGSQTAPAFSTLAPARFYRGSRAVLYRVFLNGPVRCLDLVVGNADNFGSGHLYYQKDHHYHELTATFELQQ